MSRILVADDEPGVLRGLDRFLTKLGHQVVTVANGREAMAAIEAETPDVLVTDINMPDMDGIEILNALRGRGIDLPVIAMSGGGQFNPSLLLGSARVLGAVVTLEKPFELEALGELIDTVLKA